MQRLDLLEARQEDEDRVGHAVDHAAAAAPTGLGFGLGWFRGGLLGGRVPLLIAAVEAVKLRLRVALAIRG